jgi:hypothetical protein
MLAHVQLNDIINDIFENRTDLELMEKYKIPWMTDLCKIFNHLVESGVVDENDIKNRMPKELNLSKEKEKTESQDFVVTKNRLNARDNQRYLLFGKIEICDMTAGTCQTGLEIKDISEFGLMVAPIKAVKNESKEFLIKPTHLDDVGLISFVAECRWTNGSKAGFKITKISPSHMRELQKFIKMFSFEQL